MTQTLQIGRLGLLADNLLDPATFQWSGDGVDRFLSISGDYFGTSLANTRYVRDAMMDIFNNLDDIIPITWTGDATVDGYYKSMGGEVTLLSQVNNGAIAWNATMRYIGSEEDVEFVSKIITQVRTNDHSISANAEYLWSPPAGADTLKVFSDGVSFDWQEEYALIDDTDGGTIQRFQVTDDETWSIAPASFYKGACYVKSGGNVVPGLYTPYDFTSGGDWEIGNGIIRVTPQTTASQSGFTLSIWDGTSAWESEHEWELHSQSSLPAYGIGTISRARILRNDPESVIVRFQGTTFGLIGKFSMDVRVRRGINQVEVTYLQISGSADWRLINVDTDASTAINVSGDANHEGMYRTSADADGNKWIMVQSDADWTMTTATSYATYSPSAAADAAGTFAIGFAKSAFSPTEDVEVFHGMVYEKVQAAVR